MSDLVVGCITGFLFWYLRSGDPVVAPNSKITQCVYFLFIFCFTTICVLCFMGAMLFFSVIVRVTSGPTFVLGNIFHAYADDS